MKHLKDYAALWILVAVVMGTLILTSCDWHDGSAQPGYVEIDVDHPKTKRPAYKAPKPKAPAYKAPSTRRR